VVDVVILLFVAWFLAQIFLLYEIRQNWRRVMELLEFERAERAMLLDRIMARDFGQYKTAEALGDAAKGILNPEPEILVEGM